MRPPRRGVQREPGSPRRRTGPIPRARGPGCRPPVVSRPEVLRQRDRWAEAVWRSDLPAADKLVALAYADHARDGLGSVWVTVERLVERTSLSRSGVMKCLNRLRDAGWMVVAEPSRQHRSTRYRLLVPDHAAIEDEPALVVGADQPSTGWTAEGSTSWTSGPASGPRGAPSGPNGAPSGAPGGPDLSTYLSSSPAGEGGAGGVLPSDVVEAARAIGVPQDVLGDVVALAVADISTRTSAAGRLRSDGGYAQRLTTRVRAQHGRVDDAWLRAVTRHGQLECEHGTPGGASPLPSTGQPICALCRQQRRRSSNHV